jgi:DNA-binding transcriptional LysR family regulator
LADLLSMAYHPKDTPAGVIRLAGSSTLQQAAAQWAHGFHRLHPDVECSIESGSSEAGWKSLVEGKADAALLSRPLTDAERAAWEKQSDKRLVVVVAAFERLVWIVHPSNPITELTWSPETGILQPTGKDGAVAADPLAATHWDRLNGKAEWKDVPIRLYGRGLGSGTRWHMDRLLTGKSSCQLAIAERNTAAELAEAIAADKGGLGLVGDEHAHWPGVKMLPVVMPANARCFLRWPCRKRGPCLPRCKSSWPTCSAIQDSSMWRKMVCCRSLVAKSTLKRSCSAGPWRGSAAIRSEGSCVHFTAQVQEKVVTHDFHRCSSLAVPGCPIFWCSADRLAFLPRFGLAGSGPGTLLGAGCSHEGCR